MKEQFKRKGVNTEVDAVTFNGAVLLADQCRVLHRPLLIVSLNCYNVCYAECLFMRIST